MSRNTLLLLLVALAALVVWQGLAHLGGESGDDVERARRDDAAPPLATEGTASTAGEDAGPTLTGSENDGTRAPGTAAGTAATETAPWPDTEVETVATYAGEVPAGWHEAPPAQRPHAIRPPRPRGPSVRPGGSTGGFGPTGHWSRFPPPAPPRGDASILVVVTDEQGARVVGADVYLGPRESLHEEAVSFGDLRKLGITDERGELRAPDLPAGAAVLAANVGNQLNGPRGLDARSAIPVLLVSRATVRATVTLPLDQGAFGRVTGLVVDEQKRPVARAEIRCGFFRTYADAEGRFDAPHLPAGPQSLSARRSGYASETVDVDVPRGGARNVEIVLAWAESGNLTLEGRVLTAEGAGLEGATVYLIDEGGRGTLRSVHTDADGLYVLEALPERLQATPVRLQAGKFRAGYPATIVRLEEGIRDARLDFHLAPCQVQVRFVLRDAGTGEPVDRCRVEVERLDDPEASARGFTGRREDGIFEHFYPTGRYRFAVEAPDRETQKVEADLTPPGGQVDLAVEFPSADEPAVQVTLRVTVTDQVTDAPVERCSIVVLDADGEEVARFVGAAPDGIYSMPAPSGPRTIRVSAEGYEAAEEAVELPADPLGEADVTVRLRPR